MQEHWLLVGGPAHGKKISVNGLSRVAWEIKDGTRVEYVRHTYYLDNQPYSIGLLTALDEAQDQYVQETLRSMKSG